jgi:hypothetical protein
MAAEANHWERLKNAYRQVTALSKDDERRALLALLAERDPELTAELGALLEHADEGIDEIVAAGMHDFAANREHVDPDVRRLMRIVQLLCAMRRERARAEPTEPDAGSKDRLAS